MKGRSHYRSDHEVNYVPIIVFIGKDGNIRHTYRHYVFGGYFEKSTSEIVEPLPLEALEGNARSSSATRFKAR